MTETYTKHEKNLSAFIHVSTFSRYFIPLGNLLAPLILWSANKKDYALVDHNGKQALNFQLSLLLYSILAGAISLPFLIGFMPHFWDWGGFDWHNWNGFHWNWNWDGDHFPFRMLWPLGIAGLVQGAISVFNVVFTILAAIRTHEGQVFKYPMTIPFIK